MIDFRKKMSIYDDRGKSDDIKIEKIVSSYEKDDTKVCLAIVSGEDEFLDKLIMFDVRTGRVLTSNFQFWYVKNLENEEYGDRRCIAVK